MHSITSRSTVLIFARLSNYVALLLSPVFLVRILDVESYGQYREFVLYALLIATILNFGIKGNLLYFIPKKHANEKIYTSNSIIFILISTFIGLSVLFLFNDFLRAHISFDYINILILYVFFYLNMDLIETYWLAKKRSDYVFIYTSSVLVIRVLVVILTAYYTNNVLKIVYVMTITEAIKFVVLFFWWIYKRKIPVKFNKDIALEQLRYIAPLGIGGLIAALNLKFGGIFIATSISSTALAVYSIGVYQVPVLDIVRSAVSDVIFPDMVEKNETDQYHALYIWQRANIVFCLIVFPVFFIFWIFAERFITIMFTAAYIESAPIFQLMLILMLRRCFELGTPLRSKNKNSYFFIGTIIALVTNIIITFLLFENYGLLAPAIAFVLSDIIMAVYLSYIIKSIYQINFSSLFMWKKVGIITFSSALGIPVLWQANASGSIINIILSCIGYLLIYYIILMRLKLEEAELLKSKIVNLMHVKR